jgi:hypothetical protein
MRAFKGGWGKKAKSQELGTKDKVDTCIAECGVLQIRRDAVCG